MNGEGRQRRLLSLCCQIVGDESRRILFIEDEAAHQVANQTPITLCDEVVIMRRSTFETPLEALETPVDDEPKAISRRFKELGHRRENFDRLFDPPCSSKAHTFEHPSHFDQRRPSGGEQSSQRNSLAPKNPVQGQRCLQQA